MGILRELIFLGQSVLAVRYAEVLETDNTRFIALLGKSELSRSGFGSKRDIENKIDDVRQERLFNGEERRRKVLDAVKSRLDHLRTHSDIFPENDLEGSESASPYLANLDRFVLEQRKLIKKDLLQKLVKGRKGRKVRGFIGERMPDDGSRIQFK